MICNKYALTAYCIRGIMLSSKAQMAVQQAEHVHFISSRTRWEVLRATTKWRPQGEQETAMGRQSLGRWGRLRPGQEVGLARRGKDSTAGERKQLCQACVGNSRALRPSTGLFTYITNA